MRGRRIARARNEHSLRHPGTDQVKVIEEVWSWLRIFGATLLGIPLFLRGLMV